jgi:Fe-S cluster biogenesis protein NfuA
MRLSLRSTYTAAVPAHGPQHTEDRITAQVREVVDLLRPDIQADGGDVEVVGVQDGVVEVRLHGACIGCPSSGMTLQHGILAALKARIPSITDIRAV